MKLLRTAISIVVLLAAISCPWTASASETVDLSATFPIQGKVPNMQQQIQSSGFTFQVDLQQIQYAGNVHRTILEPKGDDQFTIWVGLKNAVLTIQRTDISGRRHSAKCGPVELVLGNRRDLWIAFDVERKEEAGREQLDLVKTRFRLPRDNWSVGAPQWVKTSGFGMTNSKVTKGLREGIAKNATAVEKHLLRAAPQIFSQVERHIVNDLKDKQLVFSSTVEPNTAAVP